MRNSVISEKKTTLLTYVELIKIVLKIQVLSKNTPNCSDTLNLALFDNLNFTRTESGDNKVQKCRKTPSGNGNSPKNSKLVWSIVTLSNLKS